MKPIRVGSRESRLAVVQAQEVITRLGVPCELVTMKTTGDRILDRTLDQVGGKGLFVRELDRALAAGGIDLAVHSLKDLPMEQPDGLPVVAYLPREDARDALVLPAGAAAPDPAKPIGCASSNGYFPACGWSRCAAMCSRALPGWTRENMVRWCWPLPGCGGWGWKRGFPGCFRRKSCFRLRDRAFLRCRRGPVRWKHC